MHIASVTSPIGSQATGLTLQMTSFQRFDEAALETNHIWQEVNGRLTVVYVHNSFVVNSFVVNPVKPNGTSQNNVEVNKSLRS